MEAPLVFPDIDRRIASLAVVMLFVLALAYFAYVTADKAARRAERADALAEEALDVADRAYAKAHFALPRRVKRRK